MPALAASLFLFLAIVTGAYVLISRRRVRHNPTDERVRALRSTVNAGPAANATLRRPHSSLPLLGDLLTSSAWAEKTETELRQANIHLRVGEYLLVRVVAAALLFALAGLVTHFNAIGMMLGLALGLVGFLLPKFVVAFARHKRLDRIERQLVELTPMLASALRSGFAMQQGIELAARQLEQPISEELTQLVVDLNLGATMESAMLDFGRRAGSPDIDMLITAILVQRTSGGNLSEILDQTGETLRERERIRGDIKTLTAQQRLTGTILSVYPAAIGLLLLAIMPAMWSLMFTEVVGQVLLGIAIGLQAIGFLIMRRVMNVAI